MKKSKTIGFYTNDSRRFSPTPQFIHSQLLHQRYDKNYYISINSTTYTTMVRPVLDYASTVWDPHHQGDIKILEQVQRRAAIYGYNDYTTCTPGCVTSMVKDIGWESLEDRRSIARLSLLYKMHHGLVDVDTSSYLQQGDSRTRGRRGFFQERINNEVYFNSFFPRSIREWNNLPGDITAATSLEEFRASLTSRLP